MASERYLKAAHAVQTGVAMELERDPKSGTPKHLRTGVNLTKCDHCALVRLLIAKGVITEDEYLTAIVEETEREVERYEALLSEQTGLTVRLG